MASTRPFNHLDWPYPLKHVPSSGADLDGSTLKPTDPDGSPRDIDGHFDPNPQEGQNRSPGGVLNEGEAMFFTEDERVEVGDFLDIHHDDQGNDVERWKVIDLEREHRVVAGITGIKRRQFRIRREGQN